MPSPGPEGSLEIGAGAGSVDEACSAGCDGPAGSIGSIGPVGSAGSQCVGPLISTKLHAPARVAAHRERPRLSAQLDRTLDDATRLTVLSAPPGYGKSVAVAGWLEARAIPSSWLSLEASENDPVRFVRYLVGAIEPLRPGIARLTPALLASAHTPEAAATLIDAIGATDDPFVLVLDDYHVIVAEPVHALIRALIEHGPPFAHLVVATREDPPLPLPRLRAHGRLVELRAEDLRYTADEAASFFDETAGLELDGEHVGRLVERTEGWIAGLQLAAISLRGRPATDAPIEAFTGSQRFVLDYLASEVLDRLDPELRDFLVRISVAERFTPGMCEALTGREDSAALLERAERMNLFLIPLDFTCCWYRFHHLFADYLRTILEPAERVALRERAADCLEDEGLLDEAIDQAVAAGSIERAIALLERQARRTYEAGELMTLLGWLDALPAARVAASPELVSLRAFACFFTGRVEEAARICAGAAAAYPEGEVPGALLTVLALVAALSNRPDAVSLARAALARRSEGDELFGALAFEAMAVAQLTSGELDSACENAETALRAAGSGEAMLVTPALTALVTALNLTGRRGEAEALCRRTLAEHGGEARRMAGGTAFAVYWLGQVRYEANDLDGALNELERAWAATAAMGHGRAILTSSVSYLALARLAGGSPEGALEAVRTVQREVRAAGVSGVDGALAEIEARVSLMSGDIGAATRWADGAAGVASGSGVAPASPAQALAQTITCARVRIAQGRTDEAAQLLRRARSMAEASHDVADLISVEVLAATVAERSGDRRRAQRALEEAIARAAPERYVRRIVDDGGGVAHLLPAVRRIAPAFVDEVAAALAAGQPGQATPARAGGAAGALWQDEDGRPVEALTARELDVLRLMARGCSDAAVADELVVSLATAKWHAARIRAKFGARSRTQALLRAQQLGLV